MYTITIVQTVTESDADSGAREREIERFRQTVDSLDIQRVVALVNSKPRVRRAKPREPAK